MHFLFKKYEKDKMTFLVEKNDIFRASLHWLHSNIYEDKSKIRE